MRASMCGVCVCVCRWRKAGFMRIPVDPHWLGHYGVELGMKFPKSALL